MLLPTAITSAGGPALPAQPDPVEAGEEQRQARWVAADVDRVVEGALGEGPDELGGVLEHPRHHREVVLLVGQRCAEGGQAVGRGQGHREGGRRDPPEQEERDPARGPGDPRADGDDQHADEDRDQRPGGRPTVQVAHEGRCAAVRDDGAAVGQRTPDDPESDDAREPESDGPDRRS